MSGAAFLVVAVVAAFVGMLVISLRAERRTAARYRGRHRRGDRIAHASRIDLAAVADDAATAPIVTADVEATDRIVEQLRRGDHPPGGDPLVAYLAAWRSQVWR